MTELEIVHTRRTTTPIGTRNSNIISPSDDKYHATDTQLKVQPLSPIGSPVDPSRVQYKNVAVHQTYDLFCSPSPVISPSLLSAFAEAPVVSRSLDRGDFQKPAFTRSRSVSNPSNNFAQQASVLLSDQDSSAGSHGLSYGYPTDAVSPGFKSGGLNLGGSNGSNSNNGGNMNGWDDEPVFGLDLGGEPNKNSQPKHVSTSNFQQPGYNLQPQQKQLQIPPLLPLPHENPAFLAVHSPSGANVSPRVSQPLGSPVSPSTHVTTTSPLSSPALPSGLHFLPPSEFNASSFSYTTTPPSNFVTDQGNDHADNSDVGNVPREETYDSGDTLYSVFSPHSTPSSLSSSPLFQHNMPMPFHYSPREGINPTITPAFSANPNSGFAPTSASAGSTTNKSPRASRMPPQTSTSLPTLPPPNSQNSQRRSTRANSRGTRTHSPGRSPVRNNSARGSPPHSPHLPRHQPNNNLGSNLNNSGSGNPVNNQTSTITLNQQMARDAYTILGGSPGNGRMLPPPQQQQHQRRSSLPPHTTTPPINSSVPSGTESGDAQYTSPTQGYGGNFFGVLNTRASGGSGQKSTFEFSNDYNGEMVNVTSSNIISSSHNSHNNNHNNNNHNNNSLHSSSNNPKATNHRPRSVGSSAQSHYSRKFNGVYDVNNNNYHKRSNETDESDTDNDDDGALHESPGVSGNFSSISFTGSGGGKQGINGKAALMSSSPLSSSPHNNNPGKNKNPGGNSSGNPSGNSPASSPHSEDPHRYDLNLERVREGRDTRTTLMIRNIPNKYNQEMLLETLNRHGYKGSFDFFYLPIDFKNKCNVGYAFINFIETSTVASFYVDFNQKKWEKFNSEKVCTIAYARIQGKSSFIDHFRNSSLMYEDPTCRPLIFHSNGPHIGTLEPFPPANISNSRQRTTPTRSGSGSGNSGSSGATGGNTPSDHL